MKTVQTYVAAHAKVIVALVSLLLVQLVPDGTFDWVAVAVGLVIMLIVPNDPAAVDAVYPNRKR